jgi:hypothetical protein
MKKLIHSISVEIDNQKYSIINVAGNYSAFLTFYKKNLLLTGASLHGNKRAL